MCIGKLCSGMHQLSKYNPKKCKKVHTMVLIFPTAWNTSISPLVWLHCAFSWPSTVIMFGPQRGARLYTGIRFFSHWSATMCRWPTCQKFYIFSDCLDHSLNFCYQTVDNNASREEGIVQIWLFGPQQNTNQIPLNINKSSSFDT